MNYNDFLNRGVSSEGGRGRVRHWLGHRITHTAIVVVASVIGLSLLTTSDEAEATRQAPLTTVLPESQVILDLQVPDELDALGELNASNAVPNENPNLRAVIVENGDSLFSIFKKLDLDLTQLHRVVSADPDANRLRNLRPGDELLVETDGPTLKALHYTIDATKKLVVTNLGNRFDVRLIELPIETRINHHSGVISSSLYEAAREDGMSESLTMELVSIFGWDVDFALDIRGGDTFSVVYEEQYLNGEKLRDGDILAAEFVNQGRKFQAVRYTDPRGHTSYYTPDGRSMRKAFLRSPVDFRRISSGFRTERYHPVLGVKRPHRGVDYAAKTGTPIKASGDGKIVFRGTKGGYGRTIIIQHGSRYTTLYAHMSRFQRGLAVGSRVQQGQVIGYVGQSGLATGPHLHYEFRVDGVHRNPLTVKLPDSQPVPTFYRADFEQQVSLRMAQLDSFRRITVAANE